MPLNVLYKFSIGENTNVTIGGGPVFSFFFNGHDNKTHEVEQINTRFDNNIDLAVGEGKGQYRTLHFVAAGNIGIEHKAVFFRAGYSRSIGSFYTSKYYEGSFYHQVITGTFGVFFNR